VTTLEERYRLAEEALEPKKLARQRRQPLILIALVNLLVVGVAVTAVIDLRRLHTPGGTALKWTQAALFGVCDDYLDYSVPDASVGDSRPRRQVCQDLRASTKAAAAESGKIGLRLEKVVRQGDRATAQLELSRDGKKASVTMQLERRSGRWLVVRDALTCGSIGCP
jgi:hypothetical protein